MEIKVDTVYMKRLLAEFLVTTIFGFLVFGSIINTGLTGNLAIRLICVGVAVGLSSVAIIYAFMNHTIAHFNPAITAGAMIARKIPVLHGLGYMVAQFLGALLSVGIVYIVYPNVNKDGNSLSDMITSKRSPNANIFQAMSMEFVLTFILVFVAFATAIGVQEEPTTIKLELPESTADLEAASNVKVLTAQGPSRTGFAPIAIGFTLGFLVFLGGASSGGTFNPSLALAPTLISGYWKEIYVYLVGEFLGGMSAAVLYTLVFEKKKPE